MSSTRASKRKTSPSEGNGSSSKRTRRAAVQIPEEIIIIEDSSEVDEADDELKEILAQIRAQEESERLAHQLQKESNTGSSSNSKSYPINLEDDAALARQLAEDWAMQDEVATHTAKDGYSSDIEFLSGPPHPAPTSKSAQKSSQSYSLNLSKSNSEARELSVTKPDEGLVGYRDIFTRKRPCSKCSQDVQSPRGCVIFSTTELPPSMVYLLHAPCSSCRTNHCRGCFAPIACTHSCKGPSKNPKCAVLTCCAEGRAIAIFETLGGFDRLFISERAQSNSRVAKVKTVAGSRSVGPGGTGYGMDGRTGYYNATSSAKSKSKQKLLKSEEASPWGNAVLRTLNILVDLLPAPYSDSPQVYDMLPHASIGYLISLSQLPTLLASLLRNDSVTDWISRKETYNAMLSLLRRMADCELTIQCLIGQQWEMSSTCGLENWMWDDGEISWRKDSAGDLEILPPLYSYFKKLTKQSEAFLAGAMQMLGQGDAEGEVDETVIQGTSLCGDIIAARDDLERAIALLGKPSTPTDRENRVEKAAPSNGKTHSRKTQKGKGRDVTIHVDKVYEETCERLSFKHVALAEDAATSGGGLRYVNYNYAGQLAQTQNSTRHPQSRLHLLKELAVTATSLPAGVWVRVDEVRNDALKIMIAGPDGTPYAGGLFEFDCFLPVEYPNTPPLMHLRTTGGGSVRFNPNLYNSGKVCLSLLGTWPGRPEEQWSPKSTLLQVLVSIQSMILIDAPYYNEPGHGQANVKAPVSVAYNRNISLNTVQWAIVDWLQEKNLNGIWRDVIHSHFTVLHDKIRKQIVEWSTADPSIRAYSQSTPRHNGHGMVQPTTHSAKTSPRDLLLDFDKGMKIIKSWKVGYEE